MNTEPAPGPHAGMYPTVTRKPRRWPWIVGIVAALFAGTFVGAAVAVAPAADGEPEPAVTVTAEPEVITETVTETETVEVEVEVVPQSCLDALDQGERLSDALDWLLGWTGDYLGAVSALDVGWMDDLTSDLTSQTDSGTFNGVLPEFEAAAQQCRAES